MGVIELKKCSICKREKIMTIEYFYKDKKTKTGYSSRCKICNNEYSKKWRENNEEKDKKYHKRYREDNKEKNKQRFRDNREYREKQNKQWMFDVMKGSPSNMTYSSLHRYIKKHKEKPIYCTICNEIKKLSICSIDHTYTKDIKDWIYLCIECHRLFDSCRKKYNNSKNV